MNRIRRLGEWIYGGYAWILLCAILLVFGSLIILCGRPRYARPLARHAARSLFFLRGMPISIHGLDRVPREPHILLLNHTSFLDPLALLALLPAKPGYAFTARQQYASQALLWPLLKAVGTLIFRPSEPQHSSSNLALLADGLRQGENFIVFPEGGIVPEEGLKPFHSGAFVVASSEKVPVVIAGLHGAREALKLGTWMPRRTAITVEIGEVFLPEEMETKSSQQLKEEAREAMQPLTGEGDAGEAVRPQVH